MNPPPSPSPTTLRFDRFGVVPWLLLFLTIVAGAVVAVIVWAIATRFLNILILLLASFLIAFLLGPLIDRMERGGVARPVAILLVYLVVIGALALGIVLLLGPLTSQLQGLTRTLPDLVSAQSGSRTRLDRFFAQHGINLTLSGLRSQIVGYLSGASANLLNSTLTIALSLVNLVTDFMLILAISFYLLLDGHAMHNRAVRLLPTSYRERWFFVEAALNAVLGGYIRGQLIVAATVGTAAGVGCYLLGVHYPVVIGLLAFLFELIPMIGPVLGMLPAVLIALFQPLPLAVWVVIYFIVLQQIESNLIVPRVSGHAVGLHPLGALLALLAGVELGGLGGALISVPTVGVLWVMVMAMHADVSGQSQLLMTRPAPKRYLSFAQGVLDRRRGRGGDTSPSSSFSPATPPLNNERLASIAEVQEHLIEKFEADEAEQAEAEQAAPLTAPQERRAPDDSKSPSLPL